MKSCLVLTIVISSENVSRLIFLTLYITYNALFSNLFHNSNEVRKSKEHKNRKFIINQRVEFYTTYPEILI